MMPKVPVNAFGMAVKRRLCELAQTQKWLVEQVRDQTGLYFDGSYLHRLMTGQNNNAKMIAKIGEILQLEDITGEGLKNGQQGLRQVGK